MKYIKLIYRSVGTFPLPPGRLRAASRLITFIDCSTCTTSLTICYLDVNTKKKNYHYQTSVNCLILFTLHFVQYKLYGTSLWK